MHKLQIAKRPVCLSACARLRRNAGLCGRLRRCFATLPSKASLSTAHVLPVRSGRFARPQGCAPILRLGATPRPAQIATFRFSPLGYGPELARASWLTSSRQFFSKAHKRRKRCEFRFEVRLGSVAARVELSEPGERGSADSPRDRCETTKRYSARKYRAEDRR